MSDTQQKMRVRIQAGSSRAVTVDSFQNFKAQLGYGTQNVASGGTYGFNPITRQRVMLEWAYRGSWLIRKVVDCRADDMTREGIEIESDMPPDHIDALNQFWMNRNIWKRFNSTLKWSRLYGGALGVIMIKGQDPATPLRAETVMQGQFQGLLVLDRWMVWPHLDEVVRDPGAADWGLPKFYQVTADARHVPQMTIHHSRVIRFDGVELPYWQRMTENTWGLSVLEPMWDRMIAYDSVTQGAAQLVFKAHLRVLKIPQLRQMVATGGLLYQAVLAQIAMIRLMQTNEGLTVLDADDDFQANQYAFGGLSDMMIQFGQQVAGSADTPMTRMFGQSPAGMNSTGESDMRNYYDSCKSDQEGQLRVTVTKLLDITYRSLFGQPLPKGFNYSFKPLWQLQQTEKSQIAGTIAGATTQLLQDGVFTPKIAMKEIRQWSRVTGFGSNITDEDIQEAENAPPPAEGALPPGAVQQPGEHEPPAPGPAPGPPSPDKGGPADDDRQLPLPLDGRADAQRRVGSMSRQMQRRGDAAAVLRRVVANRRPGMPGRLTTLANIHVARGKRSRINIHEVGTVVHVGDRRSLMDVAGLNVVVETAKGERRQGHGWSVSMPCHYGYISGTASAEGPQEQMDAFVGEHPDSQKVWIIEQHEPGSGAFDEHKVMLGFDNKKDAVETYKKAFSDGRGQERIGQVVEMSAADLRQWLQQWAYGTAH